MDDSYKFWTNDTLPSVGLDEENNVGDDGVVGYDSALSIMRIIVFVIGMVGNLLVIFVLLVLREYKKTITHWYVLNLAIADVFFLNTIPFKVAEDAHNEWIFSGGWCKATESILVLNYFASVTFLTVMSFDRYIAVCRGRSMTLIKLRARRSAYIIACTVWIISLSLCTPIFLYSDKRGVSPSCRCSYAFPRDLKTVCVNIFGLTNERSVARCIHNLENVEACLAEGASDDESSDGSPSAYEATDYDDDYYYNQSMTTLATLPEETMPDGNNDENSPTCNYDLEGIGWFQYLNFMFIIMFLIPMLVMSVCYALIIRQLQKAQARHCAVVPSRVQDNSHQRQTRRTPSASTLKSERTFRRVNATCIMLVLLFIICWLPYHSYHFARRQGIRGSVQYCKDLLTAASMLTYLNSALNPFVFSFIGNRFHKRFRSAVRSLKSSIDRNSSASGGDISVRYKNKRSMNNSRASEANKVQPRKIYVEPQTKESIFRDDETGKAMMTVKEQSLH